MGENRIGTTVFREWPWYVTVKGPKPQNLSTAVSWEVRDLNLSKECARRRRQMARRQDKYIGALECLSESRNTMPPQPRGSITGVSA